MKRASRITKKLHILPVSFSVVIIILITSFLFFTLSESTSVILDKVRFTLITACSIKESHSLISLKPESSLVYEIAKRGWSVDCINPRSDNYCPFLKNNYSSYEVLGSLSINYTDPILPERKFTDYNIFVRVSKDNKDIFSLEFTKGFKWNIIQNINMQSSQMDVTKAFGQPHFVNKDSCVIGYEFDEFYMFFSGTDTFDEITVYRKNVPDSEKTLSKIVDSLKSEVKIEKAFDRIKNSLNNYDTIISKDKNIRIEYILSGISIEKVMVNLHASPQIVITIYGNYTGEIEKYYSLIHKLPNLKIVLELNKNYVFEKEVQRLNVTHKFPMEYSPDGSKKVCYYTGIYDTGIRLYYMDKSKKDIGYFTNTLASSVFWLNNRYFSYTCSQGNISYYDTKTNNYYELQIFPGKNVYLESATNGVLTYRTDGMNSTNGSISYGFDDKGIIFFKTLGSDRMDYFLNYCSRQKMNEFIDESYNNAKGLICNYSHTSATLEGIEHLSSYESLRIENAMITDSNVLKQLSKMPSLKKLTFSDCIFENPDKTIKVLGSLTHIKSLHFYSISKIHDLLPLNRIIDLGINMEEIEDTSSISKLKNLKSLNITYRKDKPISLLELKNLDSLNVIMDNSEDSIVFLKDMSKLKRLSIINHIFSNKDEDAETLASLKNLQYLTLDSQIIDLTPFSKLENLIELDAKLISSKDYSPLLKLKKLKKLIIPAQYNRKIPGLNELKKKGIVVDVEIGC